MSYRVIHCDQGTPEWHQARAGRITASMFKVARQRMKVARDGKQKGDFTDTALNYAFRVAFERISGEPMDEGYTTWQMERGHELEPAARREHEILAGVSVERAGFVETEDGKFGGSADGLIGPDGGSEYKCFVSPVSLRPILMSDDVSDIMDQCQGGMWITGRKWWHLGIYCPQLAPAGFTMKLYRIVRDDDYINAMVEDLMVFEREVSRQELALRALAAPANSSPFAKAA